MRQAPQRGSPPAPWLGAQLPENVLEAFPELCCCPVGAFWLHLTTYVIFMEAAPKKGLQLKGISSQMHVWLSNKELSNLSNQASRRCLYFGVHFPSGFVKVSSGRSLPPLDSWAWLLACWKAALSLEKSLFQGRQFSEVEDEFAGGGGSGRWGRCTTHGLMDTARSIGWTLLVVAIGMRRLASLNHSSSGAMLKNVTGFLLFTATSFLNQGSFKSAYVYSAKGGYSNLKKKMSLSRPKQLKNMDFSIILGPTTSKPGKYNIVLIFSSPEGICEIYDCNRCNSTKLIIIKLW